MLYFTPWNRKARAGIIARIWTLLKASGLRAATHARVFGIGRLMATIAAILILPATSSAAIAVDTTTQYSNTGSAGNIVCGLHTVTGSNTLLLVESYYYTNTGTDTWTATEYKIGAGATTSLTTIAVKNIDTNYKVRLAYALGLSGTVNICTTLSTNAGFNLFSLANASYTGVSQTGFPDASSSGTAAGHADIVGTVTTIADNSWVAMAAAGDDDNSCTAGAGTTVRQNTSGATHPNRACLVDTNAAKTPAGSVSLTVTPTVSTTVEGWIIVSFAPAGGAVSAPPPLWPFFFFTIGPIIPRKKQLIIRSN